MAMADDSTAPQTKEIKKNLNEEKNQVPQAGFEPGITRFRFGLA